MADTTATTTETTSGDTSHPSEFSQPVGVNDGDVFDKFFGEDSDLWDKNGKLKEGSSPKLKKETSTSADSKRGSDSEKKRADSKKEPEPKADKKTDASRESESRERSSKKEASSKEESTDSSRDTGQSKQKESKSQKTDDESEATDPKKTYAEAKAATDRRTQRRLYKKAMEQAFGEVPEEFDDRKWAAAREKREKDTSELAKREESLKTRLNTSVQRLTPAITVMKKLMGAGFAHVDPKTNTVTNNVQAHAIDQAIEVMKALREIENGDFTVLGDIIAKASGVDRDEAMRRYVKGVKVSPEGRASRQAAEQARQKAEAAEARIAALERQLQDKDRGLTEQQKQAQAQERARAAHNDWLGRITEELGDHPVLKLENGAARVLRYLKKTAHPTLRSPTKTFEEAADIIVESERRRLKAARDLLEPEGNTQPANRVQRVPANSRNDQADSGNVPDSPEASFARIFDKHMAGGRRR